MACALAVPLLSIVYPDCSALFSPLHLSFSFFFKDFICFIFRQRGREGEREERNINVWLPLASPLLGTRPTSQACALTGNQTSNPLSYTSQGSFSYISSTLFIYLFLFVCYYGLLSVFPKGKLHDYRDF